MRRCINVALYKTLCDRFRLPSASLVIKYSRNVCILLCKMLVSQTSSAIVSGHTVDRARSIAPATAFLDGDCAPFSWRFGAFVPSSSLDGDGHVSPVLHCC